VTTGDVDIVQRIYGPAFSTLKGKKHVANPSQLWQMRWKFSKNSLQVIVK